MTAQVPGSIPWLIGLVPEPEPDPAASDQAGPPKELYRDIAATPGLLWKTTLAFVLVLGSTTASLLLREDGPGPWALLALVPLCHIGVALAVVDWRVRLLPRLLVLPATGGLLLLLSAEAALTGEWVRFIWAVLAGLAARTFCRLLWRLRSSGMGFGDVRLAALLGLALGRVDANAWLLGIYGGFVLFAVYALLRALRQRDRGFLRRHLPFGPFMLLGAWLGVLISPVLHLA